MSSSVLVVVCVQLIRRTLAPPTPCTSLPNCHPRPDETHYSPPNPLEPPEARTLPHGGLAPLARRLRGLRHPRRRPTPPQGQGRMGARGGGRVRGVAVDDAVRDRGALQRHVVSRVGSRRRRCLGCPRGAADGTGGVRGVAARQPQGPRCEGT